MKMEAEEEARLGMTLTGRKQLPEDTQISRQHGALWDPVYEAKSSLEGDLSMGWWQL